MNNIISLSKLIDLLAKASSKDKAFCEKFISVFSSEVGETLGYDGSLKLKGFGQFKVVFNDDVLRIVFVPDKDMADAVNEPFACFEPVELAQGVSEEVLASADDDMPDAEPDNFIVAPAPEAAAESASDAPADANSTSAATTTDEEGADETPADAVTAENVEIDFGIEIPTAPIDDTLAASPYEAGTPKQPETTPTPPDPAVNDVTPQYDANADANNDNNGLPRTCDEMPSQPWASAHTDEGTPVKSGADLLTPEARKRQEAQQEKDRFQNGSPGMSWFWVAVAYIVGMAIGFSLGFFGHDYLKEMPEDSDNEVIDLSDPSSATPSDEVIDLTEDNLEESNTVNDEAKPEQDNQTPKALSDTAKAVVAKKDSIVAKKDSIVTPKLGEPTVYDTITDNDNLTSLALKHYGNRVYWVYIFLDNQDKIKNPNNVIVGTKLRIPPKAQYDVSDTDENANVNAALRRQSEIYSRLSKE